MATARFRLLSGKRWVSRQKSDGRPEVVCLGPGDTFEGDEAAMRALYGNAVEKVGGEPRAPEVTEKVTEPEKVTEKVTEPSSGGGRRGR